MALAVLVLWAAMPACSSSSSEEGAGSPAEQFADELARLTCAAEALCCTAQGETQDEGNCRRLTAKVELMRGELFDAAVAEQCLSALATYTCDGVYPSVCLEVFYGKVPVGDPCEFGTDCARPGGAKTGCVMDGDIDHWSCKLLVTAGSGEPCGMATVTQTEMRACAEGLECSGTCEAKEPVAAKKKAGETCVNEEECAEICHPETHRCTAKDFYCL